MSAEVDEIFYRATKAHDEKDFRRADMLYTQILKIDPRHPNTNFKIGLLAVEIGKAEQSLGFFNKAIEVNRQNRDYWLGKINALIVLRRNFEVGPLLDFAAEKVTNLTELNNLIETAKHELENGSISPKQSLIEYTNFLRECGEFTKAIELLKANLARFDSDLDLVSSLARCLIISGNIEDAKMQLKSVRSIAKGHPGVCWNEVRVLIKETKISEAVTLAKHSLQDFPGNPEGEILLASCLRLAKQETKSLNLLSSVIKLNADHSDALVNRALVYLSQNKHDRALSDLETAFKIKPHLVSIWDRIIKLKIQNKQYHELVPILNKMLTIQPKAENIHLARCTCYHILGQNENAIESYEKLLKLAPDNLKGIFGLGRIKLQNGELLAAVENFKKCISIKPDFAEAYNNIGVAYERLNKPDYAINNYQTAVNLKPNYKEALNNVGNILLSQNKFEEAIKYYKKAISVDKKYAIAHNNLGNAQEADGNTSGAIQSYNKCIKLNPSYVDPYNNLAKLYLTHGDISKARYNFRKALNLKSNNPVIIENFFMLCCQLNYGNFGTEDIISGLQKPVLQELNKRPKFLILRAIRSYLEGTFEGVEAYLTELQRSYDALTKIYQNKDIAFVSAYTSYLAALLANSSNTINTSVTHKKIYHIGESHCLSYGHQSIKINTDIYQILPLITFGAKAFHFSSEENNQYKAITSSHLSSINKNSTVFVSFGEIDCRGNEGFITASKNKNIPIETLVRRTVRKYISWFDEQNLSLQHKLIFFNVPAPVYNDQLDHEINLLVLETIKFFNACLQIELKTLDHSLIDTFKFTCGQSGFSNEAYHIDNRHLGPSALSEITKQL